VVAQLAVFLILSKQQTSPAAASHGVPSHHTACWGASTQMNTFERIAVVPRSQICPGRQSRSEPQKTCEPAATQLAAQDAVVAPNARQQCCPFVQSSEPSHEKVSWVEESHVAEQCVSPLLVAT